MSFDVIVRGGMVVDGSGSAAYRADVAVAGGRIVEVGALPNADCPELDAEGCVVAPGFINVLSHAYETLQQDPRGLSDLYQGVTTEVFGEGYSLGPVTGRCEEIADVAPRSDGVRMGWPRLNDFLGHLEMKGIGPNVASFVGAHNLRAAFAGADDRPLTAAELEGACRLLADELAAGALGVGSALLYMPGVYASTEELIAYARVLAEHDALYISHIRNEAGGLHQAIDEVITIARASSARAEIYHLKASGRDNWPLMAGAVSMINDARNDGLALTADIYPYEAGGTSLAASIPPWYHDGGEAALLGRLATPSIRDEIKTAIKTSSDSWENIFLDAGGAEGVLLQGGADTEVPGRTLAEVAAMRGDADPVDTLLNLVVAKPNLEAVYFCMSDENIRMALRQPWVSICSDAETPSLESPFVDMPTHPRAYGSFARVLGPYVREGALSLEEAVRRMTSLPAENLRLADRGSIEIGAWADLAIFEPDAVQDHATYREPHRYATGMRHVVINGRVALRDNEPTKILSGRALRRGK